MNKIILFFLVLCVSCTNELPIPTITSGNTHVFLKIDQESNVRGIVKYSDFPDHDSLGLFIQPHSSSISKYPYISNEKLISLNSSLIPEHALYFPDIDESCFFVAYHPYLKDFIPNSSNLTEMSVFSNQSSLNNFINSDFSSIRQEPIIETKKTIDLHLQHKLSLVNFKISCKGKYSAEELLEMGVNLSFNNICTSGFYDFDNDTIVSPHNVSNILPFAELQAVNDTLIGLKMICIPQKFSESDASITITVKGDNSQSYVHKLVDRTFALTEGSEYDILLELNYEPYDKKESEVSLSCNLLAWNMIGNFQTQEVKSYGGKYSFDYANLDFTKTNAYDLYSNNERVASVYKELICTSTLNDYAIVIYPCHDEEEDFSKGILLRWEKLPKTNTATINWLEDGDDIYYEYNNHYPDYIYIKKGNFITNHYAKDELSLKAYPRFYINPYSGIRYPIIKVGKQIWLNSNIKEEFLASKQPIGLLASDNNPNYLFIDDNTSTHYYSSKAVNEGLFLGDFNLPNKDDIEYFSQYVADFKDLKSIFNLPSEGSYTYLSDLLISAKEGIQPFWFFNDDELSIWDYSSSKIYINNSKIKVDTIALPIRCLKNIF